MSRGLAIVVDTSISAVRDRRELTGLIPNANGRRKLQSTAVRNSLAERSRLGARNTRLYYSLSIRVRSRCHARATCDGDGFVSFAAGIAVAKDRNTGHNTAHAVRHG